ncbi:hypothetical protein QTP70_012757 [Hemibagrus guttatus]|uniref:C-C motif chemokine n=1 Tax=Hemibagrus guttatus TaxID=175788 RepID=A0AAE0R6J8_9TELE|nr:hypothetical protein QTP70_012757 [Hemibagrus guttatus]
MISRSLLLVLTCLQSFTTAQNPNIPDQCCLRFQTRPIPVRVITAYKETDLQCAKSGVIFTLQSGRELCADPGFNWVKNHMDTINQRPSNKQTQTEKPDKPVSTPSPSRNALLYRAVVSCVQILAHGITCDQPDQRLFNSQTNSTKSD